MAAMAICAVIRGRHGPRNHLGCQDLNSPSPNSFSLTTKGLTMTRSLILSTCFVVLTACSAVQVDDYHDQSPPLKMEEFFQGELVAYGVVKDFRGRVIRKFTAEIIAYWQDGIGTLEEDFVFDDGELDRRVWKLQTNRTNNYTGTAGDVVGDGAVTVAGNSAFLDYVLRIPYGDGNVDVRIDDRMYLITPSVLLNESTLKKFGIKVGELLLIIQKRDI
jgi:hypothetical protein